jgi:hypothetical protein
LRESAQYVLDHSFCLAGLTSEARGHVKLGRDERSREETRGHVNLDEGPLFFSARILRLTIVVECLVWGSGEGAERSSWS